MALIIPIRSLALLLLPVLIVSTAGAAAFLDSTRTVALPQQRSTKNQHSSSMTKQFLWPHWFLDGYGFHAEDFPVHVPIPIPDHSRDSMESLKTTIVEEVVAATAPTPEHESEWAQDASHFFLDFPVFVTASKPILRLAQVIGRVLILATDYIPDKHVSPEEVGIQVLMIAALIVKSGDTNNSSSSTASIGNTSTTATTNATTANSTATSKNMAKTIKQTIEKV